MRKRWLRWRMYHLATRITKHIMREPNNFDGRERLWMKRERCRSKLHALAR